MKRMNIEEYGLVPVVTLQSEAEAKSVLGALCRGGLPVAEICFRTECAEKCIAFAAETFPDMLVGAGTVINAEQCARALKAGAAFIVSPGLSEEVAAVCRERGVPYFAGVADATEIMRALSLGLTTVKFFPASDLGGLKMIKALSAAFPQVRFMPTGGVNEENLAEYLSFSKIAACGGSWMMKGAPAEIEEKTRRAVEIVKTARPGLR